MNNFMQKRIVYVFFIYLATMLSGYSQLPIKATGPELKPLTALVDRNLQQDIETELLKNPKWKSLISQKKMAVGIVDLRDPDNPKFARVNGNHMMYAASLPKIAILLAAMDAIEKGELKETAAVKSDMRIMISKSDNAASTRMIDRVGYAKIEAVMTDPKYGLYDETNGGGLWVGKRYGGGGDTNREPLKNLSHAATVTQVCRYYYLLANGELVNRKRSAQMLEIMEKPDLHHKFISVLDKIAPNASVYRKSGSWRTYHSDSVLVWGADLDRRYILVALIDDPAGEQIIRDLVKPVEKIIRAQKRDPLFASSFE